MAKGIRFSRHGGSEVLELVEQPSREPGPHDVRIDILYCGVCHSDLHTVRDEWGGTLYPCVPGHEIVGRVSAVGSEVGGFKVGFGAQPPFVGSRYVELGVLGAAGRFIG